MKNIVISLLVLFGTTISVYAQDRLVLRNGRTIEVNVQRSLNDRVEYTYPGETTVYERPKSAISAIYYEDGRREILDESLRNTERRVTQANSQTNSDGILWQDVKTTFTADEVSDLTRLQRVTATSTVSYKDAILKLKKKAAEIGATTVLVMDDPDNTQGEEIEVTGIAYRDNSIPVSKPSSSATASRERPSTTAETSSNTRRRRILQQMESYNNDSKLDLSEPATTRREPESTASRSSSQRTSNAPDAVELMSGRMIYGTIEEFEPDDFVSIRTDNGRIYEYSMDDVRRVQRGNAGRSNNRQSARTPSRNADYQDNSSRSSRSSSRYDDNYYDDGSVSGYKGTFDAGYTLPMGVGEKGRFEVHTSHGYQINDYLFVGAGLGLHVFSARDPLLKSNMNTADGFPRYVNEVTISGVTYEYDSITYLHGVDSSFMVLPVFLDVRGYLPMQSITPFVMFRIGYAFNLTDGFGGMGLYMNPAVGIKYNISNKLGLTFSVGYSSQGYGGVPYEGGYGFWYYKEKIATESLFQAKSAGGVTLQLGVEF